jgi:magnesium chelatase family protein
VRPASPASHDPFRPAEASRDVRERVAAARDRQRRRFAGHDWRLNAQIPSPRLKDTWPVAAAGKQLVDNETHAGRLSARGAVRVQRLAWTVADLRSVRSGSEVDPGVDEVGVALRLRTGQALDLRTVQGSQGVA